MNDIARVWASRELLYSARSYDGAGRDVLAIRGSSGVLLSAPHGVNHHVGDDPKVADMFTGSLAELLADLGAHSVVAERRRAMPWTSWASRRDEFFAQLTRLSADASFVVDIHGMKDEYRVDVCLGLGSSPGAREMRFAQQVETEFADLIVTRNVPFAGRGSRTVTTYLQSLGVPCVQVELARQVRDPVGNPDASARLVAGLLACLREQC